MPTGLIRLCVVILYAPALCLSVQGPDRGALRKLQVGNETVTIFRDDYGVPRVFAQAAHALFVGNGYAVAEDRAWQMEKYQLDAQVTTLQRPGVVGRLVDVRAHAANERGGDGTEGSRQ